MVPVLASIIFIRPVSHLFKTASESSFLSLSPNISPIGNQSNDYTQMKNTIKDGGSTVSIKGFSKLLY